MQNKIYQRIFGVVLSDILMFYKILFSLQLEQSMIISNEHGINDLPHKLPNKVRIRILGN